MGVATLDYLTQLGLQPVRFGRGHQNEFHSFWRGRRNEYYTQCSEMVGVATWRRFDKAGVLPIRFGGGRQNANYRQYCETVGFEVPNPNSTLTPPHNHTIQCNTIIE